MINRCLWFYDGEPSLGLVDWLELQDAIEQGNNILATEAFGVRLIDHETEET